MTKKIPDCEFVRNPWIVELEPGKIFRDLVVPLQFSFINEDCEGSSSKRLCVGRNGKQGVLINRIRFIQLANAVPLREDDDIVFNNRDRKSRYVPILPCFGGILIDLLKTRCEILS